MDAQAGPASPSELVDTLCSLLVPYSGVSDRDHRAAQYSPHYRLAFSLLNEDAVAGSAILDWNIRGAIDSM
jgi:phosphatidylinositol glycan class S